MSVEPDKWGVIYNPKAGTRKVQKRWKEIKEYMDSKGVPYDYVQSEGFGSVERLAGILANNGYRTIVVVGGDGALNDAINGIMLSNAEDKENIAIGIIPNGIGNDFAKYWEMSSEYKEAVDCIINNRRRKIDVGTCYYYDGQKHMTRYFLNAINIGLGARIVKITDQCMGIRTGTQCSTLQWLAGCIGYLPPRTVATLFGNMDVDGRTDSKP